MCQGRRIQQVADRSPFRQAAIHDIDKPVIVIYFQKMRQIVYDDVLQVLRRILGQFQVESDATGFRITATPFGLHAFDTPLQRLDTHNGLPLVNQRFNPGLRLLPEPFMENVLTLIRRSPRANRQLQSCFVDEYEPDPLCHVR